MLDQQTTSSPQESVLRVCTQPDCLLKHKGMDHESLARIVVHVLSGEPLEDFLKDFVHIKARSQCACCVLRFMNGGRAYLTELEWDYLNELGDWHRRRHRRKYSRTR